MKNTQFQRWAYNDFTLNRQFITYIEHFIDISIKCSIFVMNCLCNAKSIKCM